MTSFYTQLTLTSSLRLIEHNAPSVSFHLSIPAHKSSTVVFSLHPSKIDAPIACNDRPIPITSSTKYLGLTLDSKVTWKPHIEAILMNIGPPFSEHAPNVVVN